MKTMSSFPLPFRRLFSSIVGWRPLLSIVGFGITVMVVLGGCDAQDPPKVYGELGSFSLTSSEGVTTNESSLAGRPWVGHLFFSRCPAECPRMFRQLKDLAGKVAERSNFGVLSLSVDSENDIPEVLKEYRSSQGLEGDRWLLLTGTGGEVRSFATLGLRLAAPEDVALHSARFVLIDREGKIRGFYLSTEEEDMDQLEKDLLAVSAE